MAKTNKARFGRYGRDTRFNTQEEVEYLKGMQEELDKLLGEKVTSYLAAKAARDAVLALAVQTGKREDKELVETIDAVIHRISREHWKAQRDHDLAVIVARPAGYIERLVGCSRGMYWRSTPTFWPVGPRFGARRERKKWA